VTWDRAAARTRAEQYLRTHHHANDLDRDHAVSVIRALDAIDRVHALHRQDGEFCSVCLRRTSPMPEPQPWPCATVRALDGEQ
jgi:hypothetical protein